MKFMCADATTGSNSVIVYIVLIVMILALFIMPFFTNRRRNKQYIDMISSIKVGDLVKTVGGIIGRVTKITDKGEIKTIILETGAKNEKSSMEFDISAVGCVLKSTKVEGTKEAFESEETKESIESEETKDAFESEKPKEEPKKKKTRTKKDV